MSNETSENIDKQPSASESVDSFIKQKKNESASESQAHVERELAGTQEGVAEVMAGVEKPSETMSKKKEGKGDGDLKTGTAVTGDDDDDQDEAQIRANLKGQLPTEAIMIKQIRSAIQKDIQIELKKAAKLHKRLGGGSAQEYNAIIARVRTLKETLSDLFTATFAALKDVYLKYFTADGKRRQG